MLTICSSVNRHVEGYQFLAGLNRVAINMGEKVFLQKDVESFGHMAQSGRGGSYNDEFYIVSKYLLIFISPSLSPHSSLPSILFSNFPFQYSLFPYFLTFPSSLHSSSFISSMPSFLSFEQGEEK